MGGEIQCRIQWGPQAGSTIYTLGCTDHDGEGMGMGWACPVWSRHSPTPSNLNNNNDTMITTMKGDKPTPSGIGDRKARERETEERKRKREKTDLRDHLARVRLDAAVDLGLVTLPADRCWEHTCGVCPEGERECGTPIAKQKGANEFNQHKYALQCGYKDRTSEPGLAGEHTPRGGRLWKACSGVIRRGVANA